MASVVEVAVEVAVSWPDWDDVEVAASSVGMIEGAEAGSPACAGRMMTVRTEVESGLTLNR